MMSIEMGIPPPDPTFTDRTSLIQLGYGAWINLGTIGIGTTFGFSAIAVPQMRGEYFGGQTDSDALTWFASSLNLSSIVGCLIIGYLVDSIGRKKALIISLVPFFIGWLYTGLARSSTHLIIGRVITGFGVGMIIPPTRVFSAEITMPYMRGIVGSFLMIFQSIGLIAQAVLDEFLCWYHLCYIHAAFTLILISMNCFLPESPHYLLMHNEDPTKAAESLKRFRAASYNSEDELEELVEFKNFNEIKKLSLIQKFVALFNPGTCKPFAVIMTFFLLAQLSGISVFTFWTLDILQDAKCSVDILIGNIILAIARFIGAIACCFSMYYIGRRKMAIISGFGMGISYVVLGVEVNFNNAPSVIPLICTVSYVLFATQGFYPLPPIMMSEIYPLQVRGLLSGITIAIVNLIMFCSNKWFPYVTGKLTFSVTILCFAGFAFVGCFFLFYFLPETKELTLQEIEEYYNARRPTLASSRDIISSQLQLPRMQSLPSSAIKVTK